MTARKDGRGRTANTKHPETDHRRRTVHDTVEERDLVESVFRMKQDALKKGPGNSTFEQAGNAYVGRLMAEQNFRKAALVMSALNGYLNPLIGHLRLRYMSRDDLEKCAYAIRGSGHARSTINQRLGVMRQVLLDGFGGAEPPYRNVCDIPGGPPRAPHGSGSLLNKRKPIPFGKTLHDRFEGAIGSLKVVLMLVITYGLRIGEALALRHWDITQDDKGRWWIEVRHTLLPNGERKEPKTLAGERDIPISDDQAEQFAEWRRAVGTKDADQLVSDTLGKIYKHGALYDRHARLLASLGLARHGFHIYRSACATSWLISNVSIANIIKWLGHVDLSTTLESYANAIMFADEIYQALDAADLEGIVGKLGSLSLSPSARAEEALWREAAGENIMHDEVIQLAYMIV